MVCRWFNSSLLYVNKGYKEEVMGIYYYAVDTNSKQYFTAPTPHAIKAPGIYYPTNPFPAMLVMMNIKGYHFEVWNDCSYDVPYDSDYEDVTEKVFKQYQDQWIEDDDSEDEV